MRQFRFGENWEYYLRKHFSAKRLGYARADLIEMLGTNLKGTSFLDVGCGSGIHSLAAWQLGAKPVFSFDVDHQCVQCCAALKKQYAIGKSWSVHQGSILDGQFLKSVPKAKIVYAWGSLHHTGKMWKAIEHALTLVRPGGMMLLAIYHTVPGHFGSRFWLRIKQLYNAVPIFGKKVLEWGYGGCFFLVSFLRWQNPVKKICMYHQERGMEWITDVRDWLGGYPYEHATKEEMIAFCKKRNLMLVNCKTTEGLGNNVYLFRRMK